VDGNYVENPNRKDHMGKFNGVRGGCGDWEARSIRYEVLDWIVFED
jgi:hypothetical protein